MIESIYKKFEEHKYLPALKIAHDFSSDIIQKRRELYAHELEKRGENGPEEIEEFG